MEGFKLFAAGAQAFSIASFNAVCQGGRRKPNTRSNLVQSRTVTNGRAAGEGNSPLLAGKSSRTICSSRRGSRFRISCAQA
jgi:hypothetical protein